MWKRREEIQICVKNYHEMEYLGPLCTYLSSPHRTIPHSLTAEVWNSQKWYLQLYIKKFERIQQLGLNADEPRRAGTSNKGEKSNSLGFEPTDTVFASQHAICKLHDCGLIHSLFSFSFIMRESVCANWG